MSATVHQLLQVVDLACQLSTRFLVISEEDLGRAALSNDFVRDAIFIDKELMTIRQYATELFEVEVTREALTSISSC